MIHQALPIVFFLAILGLLQPSEAYVKGAVILDEYNFDKVIERFDVALVKFDAVYPFGEMHDAFKQVAEELKDSKDILIATVGIKDFGDHDNQKLAERFGVMTKKDWPALRLFVKGEDEPFTKNANEVWNINEIKKFIKEHSNLYLGLAGCLENFDKIAAEFVVAPNKEEILKKAEEGLESLETEEEKKTANTYIKYMKKALEKEDFIESERARLNKILSEGKVKAEKKESMQLRSNILTSFIRVKTEL